MNIHVYSKLTGKELFTINGVFRTREEGSVFRAFQHFENCTVEHSFLTGTVWVETRVAIDVDGSPVAACASPKDDDEPSIYKAESAVLYDGTPGSGSIRRGQ